MNVINIHTTKTANPSARLQGFKTGDIVRLKIISKDGSLWKGSIKGKLLTFTSNLEFTPGEKIRVKIFRNGNDLKLRIISDNRKTLPGNIIRQNNLPESNLSKLIIEQLRTMQIPFSEKLFYKIYKKLEKTDNIRKRAVQLLVLTLKKGIDAEINDINALEDFLFSDPGNQLNRKQRDILKMFNNISDGKSHWILTAFDHDDTIKGKMGIRYSLSSGKSDYAFFLFENTGGNWLFSIDDTLLNPKISVFTQADSIDRETRKILESLFVKLSDMGIKTDETLRKISSFDIFSHGYKDKNIDEMI